MLSYVLLKQSSILLVYISEPLIYLIQKGIDWACYIQKLHKWLWYTARKCTTALSKCEAQHYKCQRTRTEKLVLQRSLVSTLPSGCSSPVRCLEIVSPLDLWKGQATFLPIFGQVLQLLLKCCFPEWSSFYYLFVHLKMCLMYLRVREYPQACMNSISSTVGT